LRYNFHNLVHKLLKNIPKNLGSKKLYYINKLEGKLNYQLSNKYILKNLGNIHIEVYRKIREHIPREEEIYFLELLFYFNNQNRLRCFEILNTIINRLGRKKKLLNPVITYSSNIAKSLETNYIILLFNIVRIYKEEFKKYNEKYENIYSYLTNIFNLGLKKSNIYERCSILFVLIELMFDMSKLVESDYENIPKEMIDNLYEYLIDYYQIKEKKKPKSLDSNKKREDIYNKKREDTYNKKREDIYNKDDKIFNEKMAILNTTLYIDTKSIKQKKRKVIANRNKIMMKENKLIETDDSNLLMTKNEKNNFIIVNKLYNNK
jgi:hypothetical protein